MKKASKILSFIMATLIAVSVFAITAFAEDQAYAHPDSVYKLEGGADKDSAAEVAVGEMVYSSVKGSESACFKIYIPAKTELSFYFKAGTPIDISISKLDPSVEHKYSGKAVYDEKVTLDNAYYYITVTNYTAPPVEEPDTNENENGDNAGGTTTQSSDTQLPTEEKANDFFFKTVSADMPKELTVDINKQSAELVSGDTLQLKLSRFSVENINYYWRVVDDPETTLVNETDIVKVSKDGLVEVMNSGATFNKDTTVKVQAVMYYDGDEWTKTCTIKAVPANVFLTPYFDHTGNNDLVLGVGASRIVKAETNIKGGTIEWTSEDPAIATVDKGKITAVAVGKTNIAVKAASASNPELKATRYITVEVLDDYISVTDVKFSEHEGSVRVGDTLKLDRVISTSADGIPNEKVTVEFKSEKPEIATVDKDGKVTGVAVGTTRITVTVKDGAFTFTDAYELTVKEALPNWLMVIIAPIRVIYNLIMLIVNAVQGK